VGFRAAPAHLFDARGLSNSYPSSIKTQTLAELIYNADNFGVLWRILGKERVHYWKLILWTLFRHPQLFALAITLAIYGYHFRQVMDLHLV
jgi:Domain of unknown function (DUF4070)